MDTIKLFYTKHCRKKYQKCCICMGNEKTGIRCKLCVEGIICTNCVASLCENGLCGRCPICRSENWKKSIISLKTIIPINKPLKAPTINLNDNNERINIEPIPIPSCKHIVDSIYIVSSILFISYLFGILTLNICNPGIKIVEDVGWNILALFIGLIELKCVGMYCYNCIKRTDV